MKTHLKTFFITSSVILSWNCAIAQTPQLGDAETLFYPTAGLQPLNPQIDVAPVKDFIGQLGAYGTLSNYVAGYDRPNPYYGLSQVGLLDRANADVPFQNHTVTSKTPSVIAGAPINGNIAVVAPVTPQTSQSNPFSQFVVSDGISNSLYITNGQTYCNIANQCPRVWGNAPVIADQPLIPTQSTSKRIVWTSMAAYGDRTFIGWHSNIRPTTVTPEDRSVYLTYKNTATNTAITPIQLQPGSLNTVKKGITLAIGPSKMSSNTVNLYAVWTSIHIDNSNGLVTTQLEEATVAHIEQPNSLNISQVRTLGNFAHLSNTDNVLGNGMDYTDGYEENTYRTQLASADQTRVLDYASVAADNSGGVNRGRVYIAYPVRNSGTSGGGSTGYIRFGYSDIDGASFQTSQMSPTTLISCWAPSIAVDKSTGIITVLYFGKSASGTNVYMSYSTDGGANFNTITVNDASFTLIPLYWGENSSQYIAGSNASAGCDRIDIATDNGTAYSIWADTHMSYSPTTSFNGNRYGIFGRLAKFIEIAGSPVLADGNTYSIQDYIGFLPASTQITWTLHSYFTGADYMTTGNTFTVPAGTGAQGGYLTANFSGGGRDGTTVSQALVGEMPQRSTASVKKGIAGVELFNIYPNPTKGRFTVQTNYADIESAHLQVINSIGIVVKDMPKTILNSGVQNTVIDVPTLPAGLYTVRLTTSQGVRTSKLTLE